MIFFIISLVQLLIVAADIVWYRRHMRRSATTPARRGWFLAWAVSSDLIPLVIVIVAGLVRDNTTPFMLFAMWAFYAWMILALPRAAWYLFLLLRMPRGGVAAAIAVVALFVWGATAGRTTLRVNRVEIASERLPEAFRGFRIVQFSDTHLGTLLRPEHELRRLVDTINALHPDLILFCGDLINIRYTELDERAMEILGGLRSTYGVYSVTGNHDIGSYVRDTAALPVAVNLAQVIAREESMGWRVLEDSTVLLRRGEARISLSGIAFSEALRDVRHSGKMPDLDLSGVYRDTPDSLFNITVAHLPQMWELIVGAGYGDLTLSGHVHSMQMKLRLFGGRGISPAGLIYKRWSGRYDDAQGHTLYINDGTGYVLFPMRLGAYPEITLITLTR